MPYAFTQARRKGLKYDNIYECLYHCFCEMICPSGPNQMTIYFLSSSVTGSKEKWISFQEGTAVVFHQLYKCD